MRNQTRNERKRVNRRGQSESALTWRHTGDTVRSVSWSQFRRLLLCIRRRSLDELHSNQLQCAATQNCTRSHGDTNKFGSSMNGQRTNDVNGSVMQQTNDNWSSIRTRTPYCVLLRVCVFVCVSIAACMCACMCAYVPTTTAFVVNRRSLSCRISRRNDWSRERRN